MVSSHFSRNTCFKKTNKLHPSEQITKNYSPCFNVGSFVFLSFCFCTIISYMLDSFGGGG